MHTTIGLALYLMIVFVIAFILNTLLHTDIVASVFIAMAIVVLMGLSISVEE